jgi:hypothetical protein
VDDFVVQYVGKEHAQHLIDALETDYTVSKDLAGGIYCGITLKWDYENKHVDLSMPGYIKDALHIRGISFHGSFHPGGNWLVLYTSGRAEAA